MKALQKITAIAIIAYFLIHLGNAVDLNYNSDDTVSIEASDEESEEIPAGDDVTTTVPPSPRARLNSDGEGQYCVTNTGLSGNCESVQDCFPRLFPLDDDENDTPGQTGVYNQNLAKFLIEAAGFCGRSKEAGATVDLARLQGTTTICCASNKSPGDFPVENDTLTIDSDYLKKPCGAIKIDKNILPDPDKIVGGRPAVLGEIPWMVAMLRRGQQFCGASLIDNRNVLTAAHCVEFMTKSDVAALRLHIGDLDLYSSKETNHIERKAKRVLYHKGFTMKNLEHDIALIHLDRPVEFSKTVQPVCLHPGNPAYDTGKEQGDVSGWGTTSSGGSQSSKLLTVNIRVITPKECNDKYAKASKKIGPGMVCAGSPGRDSCQGDSGGPLVIGSRDQAKQIGIVSWGIGCASYPGVYTRVDKYMKWVQKNKS